MSIAEAFSTLAGEADAEFDRNRNLHRRRMHCRPGCDECCRRLFQISELEAAEISGAVGALPAADRAELVRRAHSFLPIRRRLFEERGFVEARGALPDPQARLECPALLGGRCRVYAVRPLSCRLYGAPLVYPSTPGRTFACELNFRPGERVTDPKLKRRQHAFWQARGRLEAEYDRRGGSRFPEPITVAHAIIEDFRPYRPE